MRLGMTDDDVRASKRQYLKDNRKIWKELGYRPVTAQVHDDDRKLVLAELEVRRMQRMTAMAKDPDTQPGTLHNIALRNMAKSPTKEQRRKLADEATNSKQRKEAELCLEQCRYYLRAHVNVQNNYDPDAPYQSRVRMEAKAVAFMNLGAAYYHLAEAIIENAERMSVFGLNEGDDG